VKRDTHAFDPGSCRDSPGSVALTFTLVFIAAVGLLGVLGWQVRSDPFFVTPVADALSYHEWAMRIAEHGLSAEPVFHQAPLFPTLLAAVYMPQGSLALPDRALVLQGLLAALAIALLVPLTRACLGSSRAGLAAGLLCLAYAPVAFHAVKLLPIPLALVTQATAVLLTAVSVRSRSPWVGAAAGVACGVACLARSELLLYLPVAGALVMWGSAATRADRRRRGVAFLCGAVIALAPATLHNLARGDRVLIASSGGENLFIGNQRGADGGHTPLGDQAGDLFSQRALAREIAERDTGKSLRPSEISRYWARRALHEVTAAPLAWIGVELRKLARIVDPGDPTDMYSLPLERDRYLPVLWALPLSTWGLFALAGIGIYRAGSERRRALPLLALIAVQLVVLLLFFVSTRLRLPFLFALMPFAGLAVTRALERPVRRGPVLLTGLFLIATSVHGLFLVRPSAREVLRLASVLSLQGRLDESLAVTAPWIAADPPDALAVDHAGWVHSKMQHLAEARDLYRRALELGLPSPGREAQTRTRLASVLERMQDFDGAEAQHDAAVAAAPDRAGPRYERAMFLLRRGHSREAIEDLREATRLEPGWSEPAHALRSLGIEPATDGP